MLRSSIFLQAQHVADFTTHCCGLKCVSVIGAGLMGSGIVQIAAQNGYNVHMIDLSQGKLDKSFGNIQKNVQRIAKKKFAEDKTAMENFVTESLSRINISSNIKKAAMESDLIIEAIVENLDAKHTLFRALDEAAPAPCIFASNTSSLSVAEISQVVKRGDRFGGLHFFNPVPVMRLLEVVCTDKTSEATVKALLDFGAALGKTTVMCRDTPGFIVNRLLVPYMMEAIRLIERGDATAADVDTAMRLGAGHPMGPFELSDYIGLDTLKLITDGWAANTKPTNPLVSSSPTLDALVKDGKFGRKTGEGFFRYDVAGNMVK